MSIDRLEAIVIERGFGCAEVSGLKGPEKVCFEKVIPAGNSRLILVEEFVKAGRPRIPRLVRVADPSVVNYLESKLKRPLI